MIEEKLHKELDWLSVKHIDADKIIETILSICKQEIEQAEIRGWNKCYRTYIEDNDDNTALTNEQEIAEACKKQREICARIFLGNARQPNDNMAIPELNFRISEIIKNAPSPLDEVKK